MPINLPTYEQQQQAITLLQELGIDVDTLLAGRVVKSVQRGAYIFVVNGNTSLAQTVNISNVDLNKSVVLVSYEKNGPSATVDVGGVSGELASSSTLKLRTTGTTAVTNNVYWQVIEFY